MKKILLLVSLLLLLVSMVNAIPTEMVLSNTEEGTSLHSVSVVITASRYISVQPNSTILKKDDLVKFKDSMLPDVLESLPGIQIKRYGGKSGGASISMQGAETKQTLVLLNGSPIHNPIYGSVDFNNINISNIELIEAYRGGMSSVYGANAVGGVINIITKQPIDKTILKLGYGSFNDQTLSLEHSLSTDFFNYRLNYSAGKYDGFRPVSYFDNRNFASNINLFLFDDLNLNLNFSNYFSRQGNPGSSSRYSSTSEQQNEGYTIQENIYANLGDFGDSKLYLSQSSAKRTPISGNISKSESWGNNYGYQHQFTLGKHSVIVGGEVYSAIPKDDTLTKNITVENKAFFINDEFQLTPFWKLNFGARSDQHSKFDQENTYKLSSSLALLNNSRIKTSYGTSFRAPNISDLYYHDSYSQGNADLQPEKAQNFDLELSSELGKDTNIRLSYFQKNIRNLIQWSRQNSGEWIPENIGKVKLSGLEFEYNSKISSYLKYDFNVTLLTNAVDEESNKWLKYRPRYKAVLLLISKTNLGLLSSRVNYVSERSSSTGGSMKMPAYWTVDLDYSWKWLSWYMHNIFNHNYEEYYQYPMPGRTMGVEVRYEF